MPSSNPNAEEPHALIAARQAAFPIDRRMLLGGAAASIALGGIAQRTGAAATPGPYQTLLATWCDGLLAHQVKGMAVAGDNGGFLCPACLLVHGRSGDAVYPLLAQAQLSGEERFVAAAQAAYDWSEANTARADGSWVNDPALSGWQGITVFRAVALAEALHRHGDLLDRATRERWRARLIRATAFLDSYITFDVGNINYPITAAYAAALAARVLGSSAQEVRGKALAHQALDYITSDGLLFGEGHPQRGVTPKGCRPIDLGYNVEESLPALALYAMLTGDTAIGDAVTRSLAAHLAFMLPDGAWDNSWGSRNYKWSWWGSRTSDGCQGAYALFADRDPRFGEAARRNLALMARTTTSGLLAGGPDYVRAGYTPCLHHSLSHAKMLATVIDTGAARQPAPRAPVALPCDRADGLQSWPDIDTHRIAVGDWRATITGYDFDYLAPTGGGHATGGALSLLYHARLGPLLAAGMNAYKLVEPGNQQLPRDARHRANAARIEIAGAVPLTSAADYAARVIARAVPDGVEVEVDGTLRPATEAAGAPTGPAFHLHYAVAVDRVTIRVRLARNGAHEARLILPVICRQEEAVTVGAGAVRIAKTGGTLVLSSTASFEVEPETRAFNLVPGFLFVELALPLPKDDELMVTLRCS